jgi:hypothetical protein
MTVDEMIVRIDSLSPEQRQALRDDLGIVSDVQEQTAQEPKAMPSEKIKCKVCGFHKKARRVQDGVCKSCRTALDSDDVAYAENPEVEVIGRMGKRGRNSVSVVIDGKRWKVKRLSSAHSERVAARYMGKSKGYAKRGKREGCEPVGLPTNSRLRDDERG